MKEGVIVEDFLDPGNISIPVLLDNVWSCERGLTDMKFTVAKLCYFNEVLFKKNDDVSDAVEALENKVADLQKQIDKLQAKS